jgi:glycosyltransferase involved in cell wall biosynthesis
MRFTDALARELARRPRPAAVVAHMCPIYAVLAAPLCRPLGVRVVLWFTHWRRSRLLEVAERLSTDVITVDRRSFPLPSRKVSPIGHGIDLSDFACTERASRPELRAIALGRTSPAKGLETVVRGACLVPEVSLEIRGPSLTDEEREHRQALESLIDELGVADRVRLLEAVPRAVVPDLLAGADVLVNNMRSGATDKVVYEAAASCLPVLASNPAFDTLLPEELRFERDDPATLADRLRALLDADRNAIGRALRAGVEVRHGVDGWADRVVAVASGAPA